MNDPRDSNLYECCISTDGGTMYTTLNNQFFIRVAGEYKYIRSYVIKFYDVMVSPLYSRTSAFNNTYYNALRMSRITLLQVFLQWFLV